MALPLPQQAQISSIMRMLHFRLAFVALLLLIIATACSTVPITGRSQLNLVDAQQINTLASQQYREMLNESKVQRGTANAQMVQRAGQRISSAVESYLRENGQGKLVEGFQWEYTLIDDPAINAFCMPGGKIGVYTGLLPVAQTEEGLAVVMGHEVAHAIAQHSNERMSQQMFAQLGTSVVDQAVQTNSALTKQLLMTSVGLGAQYGILLPYGRTQESEADRLGLIFMARAGYNPEAAIPFWQRMAVAGGGARTPEFLSTHPNPDTRIRDIQKWLPEAKRAYVAR